MPSAPAWPELAKAAADTYRCKKFGRAEIAQLDHVRLRIEKHILRRHRNRQAHTGSRLADDDGPNRVSECDSATPMRMDSKDGMENLWLDVSVHNAE